MNKYHFTLILLLSLVFFANSGSDGQFPSSNKDMPFKLEKESELSINKFVPFDIDGDGKDEISYVYKEEEIAYSVRCYAEPGMRNQFQINFSKGRIEHPPFYFWNEDHKLILLVSVTENDTAFLYVYRIENITDHKIGRYEITRGIDHKGDGTWDGHVAPMAVVDLNNDGSKDVVFSITTRHDLHPRGVCGFDLKNGEILWKHPTGAYISWVKVADLNRDGVPEIILGSGAMNNGSVANGTDDKHSYLIILNNKGELVNLKEMGEIGSFCYPQLVDIDGDDMPELVTLLNSTKTDKGAPGRLTLWEGAATTKKGEDTADFYNGRMSSVDINKDGKEELILVGGIEGHLFVFGDNLVRIAQKKIGFQPQYLMVADLNADAGKEIIISGIDKTVVYNDRLKPIAQTSFAGRPHIVKQGYNLPEKLVLSSRGTSVFLNMKRNITYYNIRFEWLLLGIAIGAIAVIVVIFGITRASPRNRYLRTIQRMLEKVPVTVVLFDKKGKILISNDKAHEFVNLQNESRRGEHYSTAFIKELQDTVNSLLASINPIDAEMRIHKNTQLTLKNGRRIEVSAHVISPGSTLIGRILVCIQDVSLQSESKRALEWAAMSQKLAHEIKNPLYTILLTLQRLQLAYQEDQVKNLPTYDKYTNSAIDEVGRLQRVADGFMKFTTMKQPEFIVMPAEALVKQIEERSREWLPQKVNLKVETERNLPDIKVDIDLMQRLFFNLFDNAVKAVNGKGRLSFKASLLQPIEAEQKAKRNEMVLFELSDTGCGIAEEHILQLFDPYFSERDGGTGLGLTICKKIVEDHQGKISIQSKVGVGTTVKVEIPVFVQSK